MGGNKINSSDLEKAAKKDPLTFCVNCNAIQEPGSAEWITRYDDKAKYNLLMEQYEKNLDHEVCDSCLQKQREIMKRYIPKK